MAQMISTIRNGVDTQQLFATLDAIKERPELGAFTFRAHNRWINGAHNRTRLQNFYGAGREDDSRREAFVLDAGEPPVLLGTDSGPSGAEYLLHALVACLTTTIVYCAAVRKIRLTEIESTVEADMDVAAASAWTSASATGSRRSASPSGSPGRRPTTGCVRSSNTRSSAR